MLEKAQVVMLPTEKASNLLLTGRNDLLYVTRDFGFKEDIDRFQHLYFTTEEGGCKAWNDWLLDSNTGDIFRANVDSETFVEYVSKIVATTNPDLWPKSSTGLVGCKVRAEDGVAKIPEDFIQAYVREQGAIKEVMLEYEAYTWAEDYYFPNDPMNQKVWKLKLNNNGTVKIHKVSAWDKLLDEIEAEIEISRGSISGAITGLLKAKQIILKHKT